MYNLLKILSCVVLLPLLALTCRQGEQKAIAHEAIPMENRIVSLSGFLTEVIYDLGYGEQVVGVDITSTYPADVNQKPKLGHASQLNIEQLLELEPSVLFLEKSQVPSLKNYALLKESGMDIVEIATSYHYNNALNASQIIATKLGATQEKATSIKSSIQTDSLKVAALLSQVSVQPKVLFIYARGTGRVSVAGTGTSAAAIIEKAGGTNAITAFEGFKQLTPESLIQADPDVILLMKSGLASLDGKEGLAKIPGISQTKAFQNDRIIAMDGHYLLSFGPRVGQAAMELATQMHDIKDVQ